jgi:hypothetical protein
VTRTYTETITLEEETCAECGIMFAAPSHWFKSKQSSGAAFYCPNGHRLSFAKGTETILREQLQSEQERYRQLELQLTNAKDQLQATRQELQKHKKRTANGVCPCCNRSFMQLQRHMKTKHPEYGNDTPMIRK